MTACASFEGGFNLLFLTFFDGFLEFMISYNMLSVVGGPVNRFYI